MSVPTFLHVMANGDLWISSTFADTPSGTVAGVFRIGDLSKLTKIGTVSGSTPNCAVSNATGKGGKELGV